MNLSPHYPTSPRGRPSSARDRPEPKPDRPDMSMTQKNYSHWFIDSVDEATILSRIRAEIDKTYAQAHAHKATSHSLTQHFQDLAAYRFAELNGWTTGPHVRSFRVEDIGRRS